MTILFLNFWLLIDLIILTILIILLFLLRLMLYRLFYFLTGLLVSIFKLLRILALLMALLLLFFIHKPRNRVLWETWWLFSGSVMNWTWCIILFLIIIKGLLLLGVLFLVWVLKLTVFLLSCIPRSRFPHESTIFNILMVSTSIFISLYERFYFTRCIVDNSAIFMWNLMRSILIITLFWGYCVYCVDILFR